MKIKLTRIYTLFMDIVSRLKTFIEYLGLTNSIFADHAGITRPTLSQILNGRNKKISNELISKIHDAFPSLNIMWLMFGDGTMIVGESYDSPNYNNQKTDDGHEHVTVNKHTEKLHEMDINLFDLDERPSQSVKNAHPSPTPTLNDTGNQHINTLSKDKTQQHINSQKLREYPAVIDEVSFWDDIAENHSESGNRQTMTNQPGEHKEVSYIMVFYTDNSFEVFKPQNNAKP